MEIKRYFIVLEQHYGINVVSLKEYPESEYDACIEYAKNLAKLINKSSNYFVEVWDALDGIVEFDTRTYTDTI